MLQRTWILHLSSSCCLFMNIFALKRNHTSRLVAWCAYACSTSMLKTWGTSQMGTLTIFDSFIICWKSIPQLGCMWFVKTEIIFTDKTCWSKIKITISKEEMKDITNFEYLGFIIANNRHCSQQARKRWTVAMQSVNSIKKNGSTAARQIQVKMLQTCICPMIACRYQSWNTVQSLKKKIWVFELECCWNTLRIVWMKKGKSAGMLTDGSLGEKADS